MEHEYSESLPIILSSCKVPYTPGVSARRVTNGETRKSKRGKCFHFSASRELDSEWENNEMKEEAGGRSVIFLGTALE